MLLRCATTAMFLAVLYPVSQSQAVCCIISIVSGHWWAGNHVLSVAQSRQQLSSIRGDTPVGSGGELGEPNGCVDLLVPCRGCRIPYFIQAVIS